MNDKRLGGSERLKSIHDGSGLVAYSCPHCGRIQKLTESDIRTLAFERPDVESDIPAHVNQYFPEALDMLKEDNGSHYLFFTCGCRAPVMAVFTGEELSMCRYQYFQEAVYELNKWPS